MTTFTVSAINKTTAIASFIGTYKTLSQAVAVANNNKISGYLVHVIESDGFILCAKDCAHDKAWKRPMTTCELAYFGESVYTAR